MLINDDDNDGVDDHDDIYDDDDDSQLVDNWTQGVNNDDHCPTPSLIIS